MEFYLSHGKGIS